MSASSSWEEGNARYLAAGMEWLRLRLERMAGEDNEGSSARIVAQRREIDMCEAAVVPPPALAELANRLCLSSFERDVLMLCVARELDTRIDDLCARAQGHVARAYPTFALAMTLFDGPAWDALSPSGPLRYWKLVEPHRQGAGGLTSSPLSADERIVNYVKGLNHLDERLAPLLMAPEADDGAALHPSQEAVVDRILQSCDEEARSERATVVVLLGSDTPSKWLVARRACARLRRRILRISAELLPSATAELDDVARLLYREYWLTNIAFFFDRPEAAGTTSAQVSTQRLLARAAGLFFVDSRDVPTHRAPSSIVVDVSRPTRAEQREAWARALGPDAGEVPAQLAAQFDLDAGRIQGIGDALRREHPDGHAVELAAPWALCRAAVRPHFDTLAQRIDAKARWDDLVLPEMQTDLLRQITAQVRCRSQVYDDWGFAGRMNRGLSISALFEGVSGVGKTMAAEVLANDLQLDLYRIDLSAVISKYIGETEESLRRVFDAAEDGGAILFFDECDALFGKRSEVKDSHDRFANIQTNYLLQRLEAFRGLAILATNMKSALDAAFVRRLRFIVNFPFPEAEQRESLWRKALPPDVPRGEIDFAQLARINMTGGSIHSAALCAAFLAARANSPVTMALARVAIHTEFVKLGRPISASELDLTLH